MSVIAQAIADRQSEIERLQAEIKALSDVEKLLGWCGFLTDPSAAYRKRSEEREREEISTVRHGGHWDVDGFVEAASRRIRLMGFPFQPIIIGSSAF